jgi:D-aminopeptidase
VLRTIKQANDSAVVCGSVGIGRSLCALGAKGGVGDASRSVKIGEQEFSLGVLIAANGGTHDKRPSQNVFVNPSLVLIAATDIPLLPEQLRQLAEAALRGLNAIVHVNDGTQQLALAFSTSNTIDGAFEQGFKLFKERALSMEKLAEVWAAAGACSRAALRRALESAQPLVGRKSRQAMPLRRDELEEIFWKKEHEN